MTYLFLGCVYGTVGHGLLTRRLMVPAWLTLHKRQLCDTGSGRLTRTLTINPKITDAAFLLPVCNFLWFLRHNIPEDCSKTVIWSTMIAQINILRGYESICLCLFHCLLRTLTPHGGGRDAFWDAQAYKCCSKCYCRNKCKFLKQITLF